MTNRKLEIDLIEAQKRLRQLIVGHLYEFDANNLDGFLGAEPEINSLIEQLESRTNATADQGFFRNYSAIIKSIFNLVKWWRKEINADPSSAANRTASLRNAELIDFDNYGHLPDFKEAIENIVQSIVNVKSPSEILSIIKTLLATPFPTIMYFERPPFEYDRGVVDDGELVKEVSKPLVLAFELAVDREPWANPNVLKPNLLYELSGTISANYWPDGYTHLLLQPVSSASSDSFTLSFLPVQAESGVSKHSITGTVLFKYPQSNIDNAISIKILPTFRKDDGQSRYPDLMVGYTQLIAKVIDSNSPIFLSGFIALNNFVLDAYMHITKAILSVNEVERTAFIKLLNGVLNYQGFCAQRGTYKELKALKESEFRDRMIQHLTGLPYLGEDILEEATIAGGRVEITYKGIVVELKVEKEISERDKLVEKYGKQPVPYASGNLKQLSIICILDLTEKSFPPGPPQNNLQWITPVIHGFENNTPEYPAGLALIIIDGNTKKPSEYSK
jgi:hypothetical protein